ncbi:hypothetical protein FTUN_2002 [Frigoriglobus tundricola]|uniref:Uncharacterized protein n=1 Tax=Frigoriglobus tundricola TaxID=2774151 RepID=A0A6M5YML4_9BACT|nr:hypothetical protein FTUN_2002 [Frigoriglobus tundricola]
MPKRPEPNVIEPLRFEPVATAGLVSDREIVSTIVPANQAVANP